MRIFNFVVLSVMLFTMFPLLTLAKSICLLRNRIELMLKRPVKEKGRSHCVGLEAQLPPRLKALRFIKRSFFSS